MEHMALMEYGKSCGSATEIRGKGMPDKTDKYLVYVEPKVGECQPFLQASQLQTS